MTPPISPDQAVDLAKTMIAACDGATFCTIGKVAALAVLCDSLPVPAAQAVNAFLVSLGVS
jgi:hypothetical protein